MNLQSSGCEYAAPNVNDIVFYSKRENYLSLCENILSTFLYNLIIF